MTDLTSRVPSILEALRHSQAARDEVARAEHSLAMDAEFARYALEDYAHRPDIATLLDALAAYQAAQAARESATATLIAALEKELDR